MVVKIEMADLILMPRCIREDSLYTYEQFGVDRKLYVEVIKGRGKKGKREKNGFQRPAHWSMSQLKDFHNFCSSRHEDDN